MSEMLLRYSWICSDEKAELILTASQRRCFFNNSLTFFPIQSLSLHFSLVRLLLCNGNIPLEALHSLTLLQGSI